MNVIAEIAIAALRDLQVPDLPHYTDAIVAACAQASPVFGHKSYGDNFRAVSSDPRWLAGSLIENSYREGDGASRLWSLAACTADRNVSAQVKQHAIDESRHSRWYIALLDIVFPNALDPGQHKLVESVSPVYTHQHEPVPVKPKYSYDVSVDDLVQMNIAEIRTCVHHSLQRTMLFAYCDPEQHNRLLPILDSLLHDEKKHVAYTARLIEAHAQRGEGDAVREHTSKRLQQLCDITHREIEQNILAI